MATHSVFLPRESHGQRSLADYSPWGHKESDTTEVTNRHNIPVLSDRFQSFLMTSTVYSNVLEDRNLLCFFRDK